MGAGQHTLQLGGLPRSPKALPTVLQQTATLETARKGSYVRPQAQEVPRGEGAAHKGQQKELRVSCGM